jgi:DUF4097 and DUF4098 domain-containing protein YvlB
MKRMLLGLCLAALGVVLMYGREKRVDNAAIADKEQITSDNCSDHFHNDQGRFAAVASGEETRTVANQPLNIHAEKNGGIRVTTWDGPEFSIKLCKQAAADDEVAARKIVDQTKLAVEGSTVSVAAPENLEHSRVATLLLVKAPKAATVSLKVKNGGASIYKFNGTADAETTNGGISLKSSTGKLTVQAKNGGVSIRDCSGEVSATVANGGISIALPERWEGKGLEAHTQNGGLSIAIPKNFNSGLEVVSSRHVGVVCRGTACQNAQKTVEDGRQTLRLGTSPAQVHASTQNGGIVIKELEREYAKE